MITININIDGKSVLDEMNSKLDRIIKQGEQIMSVADDIKAILAQASAALDELVVDVNKLVELVTNAPNPDGTISAVDAAEISNQLSALKDRLVSTAGLYTPPAE